MRHTITEQLKEVVRFRHEKPEQVIAEALDIGLQKMWVDTVLLQYLKKQISRRKAVHLVGLDIVRLAEHQDRIIQSDINWGMTHEANRH